MFQAIGLSAHPVLPRIPHSWERRHTHWEKAQNANQQPTPPLLPARLLPRSQNPHRPTPQPLVSDGILWRGQSYFRRTSPLPAHLWVAFALLVFLLPRVPDCSSSGPQRFGRDGAQRMNGSVFEEMGEEEHFMAKGKVGAKVKKLETEFLGVAGGVLDPHLWVGNIRCNFPRRALRVSPSR